ncbi:hypothetical protein [uncultured Planktosalinus sp.]|uniref:hypothetical protein n=1 Tax=uncultured Planktosalinus sp. TaxID=1810935 RepID=UPI0030D8FAAD
MKPIFTLFAFLLIVSQVFAQLPVEHFNKWRSPDGRNIDFLYLSNSKTTAQYPRLEVIGSPFENDKFQPAYINKQDGSTFSPLFMRYNAYYDIMELKHATSEPDSLIMILEKTPEFTIHINDKKYLLLKEPNSNENLQYFEVLQTGNTLQLLKKTTKKFVEGKIARTSFEKDFPHRFNDHVTYYIKDKSLTELPRSKRKK